MSKDPILFKGGQANIYAYVGNDPVNRRDPSGLWQFFASSDVDLISGESGETNVGFVFDANTGMCGNFVSKGTGTGLNFGAGAGVGIAFRDVSGLGASLDFNFVFGSVSFLIDTGGWNGFLVAWGPGAGVSASMTNTDVTWY